MHSVKLHQLLWSSLQRNPNESFLCIPFPRGEAKCRVFNWRIEEIRRGWWRTFFGGVGRGDRWKKREESDELLDQQRVNVDRSVSRYLLEKILKTDIAEQPVETMMARVMSDGPSSRSNSLTGHRWSKIEWRSDESVKRPTRFRWTRGGRSSLASYDAREKLTKPCDASKTGDITVRQHSCTDAGLYDVVAARVVLSPFRMTAGCFEQVTVLHPDS